MKKYVPFVIAFVLAISFFLSQRSAETSSESRFDTPARRQFSQPAAFSETRPLRDIANAQTISRPAASALSLFEVGAKSDPVSGSRGQGDADQSLATFGSTQMPAPTL